MQQGHKGLVCGHLRFNERVLCVLSYKDHFIARNLDSTTLFIFLLSDLRINTFSIQIKDSGINPHVRSMQKTPGSFNDAENGDHS